MEKTFALKGFGSTAVHAGHQKDEKHAHQLPIYASSTFVYDSAEQGMRRFSGKEEGYIYSRWDNPSFTEAEEKIAALETFGLGFSAIGILHASGMGAINTLFFSQLKSGDKILSHFSLYSGTEETMQRTLPSFGVETIISDLRDLSKVDDLFRSNHAIRMLYLETPANPTMQCVDLEALCALAKKYDVLVAVDNTFATPYLQQPFRFGADFIVHSTTKFLNGHGTAIGGILLGTNEEVMRGPVSKTHRLLGNNASPFDAFLLVQGIKTLPLRMDRHCANAQQVAEFLNQHPAVASVNFPGLKGHPDEEIVRRQMRKAGGMLSFELKEGIQGGINFMNKLQMCVRTVSLGTVDTLLSHPASMTHHSVPKEQREKYGITDGLIRMNVGIEDSEDIIADLAQALS